MQVSQISGCVDVRTWKTETEMNGYLQCFETRTVLGNLSPDSILGSFVYQLGLVDDRNVDLGVGIRWTAGAFEPQLLAPDHSDDDLLLVGFDAELVALSRSLGVDFKIEFESYLRSIRRLHGIGILAIEEIGVTAISPKGAKLWSVREDILTGVNFERKQELILSFMDSPPISVNVLTGKVTKLTGQISRG